MLRCRRACGAAARRRTARAALVELMEEGGLPPVCVAEAVPEEYDSQLGAVLAAAVQARTRSQRLPRWGIWLCGLPCVWYGGRRGAAGLGAGAGVERGPCMETAVSSWHGWCISS